MGCACAGVMGVGADSLPVEVDPGARLQGRQVAAARRKQGLPPPPTKGVAVLLGKLPPGCVARGFAQEVGGPETASTLYMGSVFFCIRQGRRREYNAGTSSVVQHRPLHLYTLCTHTCFLSHTVLFALALILEPLVHLMSLFRSCGAQPPLMTPAFLPNSGSGLS